MNTTTNARAYVAIFIGVLMCPPYIPLRGIPNVTSSGVGADQVTPWRDHVHPARGRQVSTPPSSGPSARPVRPLASVRPPAPVTLILARIATITMLVAGLLVGLIGSASLVLPSTMMVTGCSGDAACLQQFFWVAVLPFAGCGAGAWSG